MIIPYRTYTFVISAKDTLHLPSYKGSTFRGAFGAAFRRVVCALKRADCTDCLLRAKCLYAYVFETPPAQDTDMMGMNKYEKVPHPFVIEPPEEQNTTYLPGDRLSFGLVLIGRAVEYLPYFIYTFDELGKSGLGKGRGAYELVSIQVGDQTVYTGEAKTIVAVKPAALSIKPAHPLQHGETMAATLEFITPTRIKYQRELTGTLEFHILIRSLLRRLNLLHYFHCEQSAPSWDHRELIAASSGIAVREEALRWHDWERYSARQGTKMKMGGLVGNITYEGDLAGFMSFIRAGEVLHVGKGTSFGLGKYRLHESA